MAGSAPRFTASRNAAIGIVDLEGDVADAVAVAMRCGPRTGWSGLSGGREDEPRLALLHDVRGRGRGARSRGPHTRSARSRTRCDRRRPPAWRSPPRTRHGGSAAASGGSRTCDDHSEQRMTITSYAHGLTRIRSIVNLPCGNPSPRHVDGHDRGDDAAARRGEADDGANEVIDRAPPSTD